MSTTETTLGVAHAAPRSNKLRSFLNKYENGFDAIGFGWLLPPMRMLSGDDVNEQMQELKHKLLIPLLGLALFIGAWAVFAPKVNTSLGAIPGPVQVWDKSVCCGTIIRLSEPKKRPFMFEWMSATLS